VVVVGIEVGDRLSELCFLEEDGEEVEWAKLQTTEDAMRKRFPGMERGRVILEVRTHSPWLSRLLEGLGHEVVVANPHPVQLIARSTKKTDRNDAETLARLGRADVALLSALRHRSVEAQATLAVVRSQEALVRARGEQPIRVRMEAELCRTGDSPPGHRGGLTYTAPLTEAATGSERPRARPPKAHAARTPRTRQGASPSPPPRLFVPCGGSEALPVGLQIIGNFFDEPRVIQAAHAFERAANLANQLPEI
jgi:hypothetical protein